MLLEKFNIPKEFERTKYFFWSEEYISKKLLEAHLSQETDLASNKETFIDKTVEFINNRILNGEKKRIIDYGCGPGLYTKKLAYHKHEVFGIDISENSINYANEQVKKEELNIKYAVKNYLTDNISENCFDLALLIFCDYGALSPSERKQVLKKIYNSLVENGKLLLDVFSSNVYNNFIEEQTWTTSDKDGFWSPDPYVEIKRAKRYNNNLTLEQVIILTENDTKNYNIWNQFFTLEKFKEELKEAGFSIEGVYSDLSGAEYNDTSDKIGLLVKKIV